MTSVSDVNVLIDSLCLRFIIIIIIIIIIIVYFVCLFLLHFFHFFLYFMYEFIIDTVGLCFLEQAFSGKSYLHRIEHNYVALHCKFVQ